MDIVFPDADAVSFEDGHAVFEAIVDGVPVSCLVTESALSAAASVDHVISKVEAFSIGRAAIFEAIAKVLRVSPGVPVVLTLADLSTPAIGQS
ncbi:DUF1488 family protein [Burkholderia multivorans]|uniref:DUF1488 family protein n=1 Tax=Burkholderia multivorans TaxID=87883 RepID=UPI0013DED3E4|nr:DUF1488 family protein [Burkholderia multivorans]NGM78771.1 DUF1488 domain-containing protein [Burkholderia multivorans]